MTETGIVKVSLTVENLHRANARVDYADVMVDTGSELTWIPKGALQRIGIQPHWRQCFILADGRVLERDVGYAMLHAAAARPWTTWYSRSLLT